MQNLSLSKIPVIDANLFELQPRNENGLSIENLSGMNVEAKETIATIGARETKDPKEMDEHFNQPDPIRGIKTRPKRIVATLIAQATIVTIAAVVIVEIATMWVF